MKSEPLGTADLFESAPAGGTLDYDKELRNAISTALDLARERGMDRYDIAAAMSKLIGHDVTKSQLDSWSAESKTDWRFPFAYAAAFEVATKTNTLQQLLARKRGTRVLVGKELIVAELGRVTALKQELAEQERALKNALREKR